MQAAIDTVKRYVPPEPARLKASAQSGKVSFSPIEPGKRVRLDFRDYLKQGDVVGVEVDVVNSRFLGLAINSYIDNTNDVVTLNGQFRTLSDGASYPAQVVLNAPAKSITVELANTGYRKQ